MNALFGWPGGKRNLTKTLLERIPEHGLYVEVFAGSAKLLFAKEPSKAEVINDLNGDVINFYRVVKHRAAELAELLEHECVHPARFRELAGPAGEDELQRALRFVYRTWYSYGSMGKHFAAAHLVHLLRGQRRRPVDLVRELLLRGQQRLAGVRLEQRDCLEMLRRFDTPDTFFYLDPPYVAFGDNGLYEPLSAEVREALFAGAGGAEGAVDAELR